MTSFFIRNFGCRVNQAEAFAWAEEFQKRGLRLERRGKRSDYVLVNSCTLTGRADRDVKTIRPQGRPGEPERPPRRDRLLRRAGPRGIRRNARRMDGRREQRKGGGGRENPRRRGDARGGADRAAGPYQGTSLREDPGRLRFPLRLLRHPDRPGKKRERRGGRGRGADSSLGANGAIGRSSWPESTSAPTGSISSLELASATPPPDRTDGRVGRIRLSSLDPRLLDEAFVERLAANPLDLPHFHLSLQSGSDENPSGDGAGARLRGQTMRILERFRAGRRTPRSAPISSSGSPARPTRTSRRRASFIVGSPLTYVHVFPFSPREGTPAAGMDPVNEKTRAAAGFDPPGTLARKRPPIPGAVYRPGARRVVIERNGRGAERPDREHNQSRRRGLPRSAAREVDVRITESRPRGQQAKWFGWNRGSKLERLPSERESRRISDSHGMAAGFSPR